MNNLKGTCFFATTESLFNDHLIVIISDPCDGRRLAVPISSIKYLEDGRPRYYDRACVIEADEIKTLDGKNVLTKPSFASYKHAAEVIDSEMMLDQIRKIYNYRCNVTPHILERIQAGARNSGDLEERFEKYFGHF